MKRLHGIVMGLMALMTVSLALADTMVNRECGDYDLSCDRACTPVTPSTCTNKGQVYNYDAFKTTALYTGYCKPMQKVSCTTNVLYCWAILYLADPMTGECATWQCLEVYSDVDRCE